MNTLQISDVQSESIVDGKGIRFVIFTQGCPHHCPGCHNPSTHDFNGGKTVTLDSLYSDIMENPLLQGVTFSGGEPICQAEPLAELAERLVAAGLDIAVYTGYTYEELLAMGNPAVLKLLSLTTMLVDGRFVLAQRDLDLLFRGSRNQRLINAKESLVQGKVVLY